MPSASARYRGPIRIVVILLALYLVFAFNQELLKARMEELDVLLSDAARQDTQSAAELIGRYDLIQRRIESGEGAVEDYRLEARLATLRSAPAPTDPQSTAQLSMAPVGRTVLSGLRWALGKEPLAAGQESTRYAIVEEGYLFERSHRWHEATAAYELALSDPQLPDDVRAVVLLHLGFVHSMTSKLDEARRTFLQVSAEFPATEYDVAAQRLLVRVDALRAGEEPSESDLVEQGRVAYQYMRYQESIVTLQRYLGRDGPQPEEARARYFKGRSHEELGQYPAAVKEYQRVSFLGDEEWSLQANRRLVMVGEFYSGDQELATAARRNLADSGDGEFLATMDDFAEIRPGTLASAPPITEAAPPMEYIELWVRSDPEGAEVEIDGRRVGESPIIVSGLVPGVSEVRLAYRGYEPATHTLVLEVGRITHLEVELRPVEEPAFDPQGEAAALATAATYVVPPSPSQSAPPALDAVPAVPMAVTVEPEPQIGALAVVPEDARVAPESIPGVAKPETAPKAPTMTAAYAPPETAELATDLRQLRNTLMAKPKLEQSDVWQARRLHARIVDLVPENHDLAEESEAVTRGFEARWSREAELQRRIAELEAERHAVVIDHTTEQGPDTRDSFLRSLTRTSLGVGGVALGVSAVTLGLGNAAYADYNAATTQQDAVDHRARTERFQAVTVGAAVVAVLALSTAATSHYLRRRPTRDHSRLPEIDAEIRELESQFGYDDELAAAETP